MDFKISIDMDKFAGDEYFKTDEFLISIQAAVEEQIANNIITSYVQKNKGYWGNNDFDVFITNKIKSEIDKFFKNEEIIQEIKNRVVTEISDKVVAKKTLAQSQFDIPAIAALTASNKSYLFDLVDECIAKKFKGQ